MLFHECSASWMYELPIQRFKSFGLKVVINRAIKRAQREARSEDA